MSDLKKIDLTNLVIKGTEWFSSLAILNLCWLLFSLPLVTMIPATDAVFEVLKEWEAEGRTTSVFKQFKQTFKQNFKQSFKWGIPILIVSIILAIDIIFLNSLNISSVWFQILKYAFYTFTAILVLSVSYAYPLAKVTGETHIRLLLIGLFMAIGHPLITFGLIAGLIVLIILFSIWPGMLFFFAVSGGAWLMTKAVLTCIKKDQEKQTI